MRIRHRPATKGHASDRGRMRPARKAPDIALGGALPAGRVNSVYPHQRPPALSALPLSDLSQD